MKTVLIIDDDPAFRKLTGEILKHHGWSVSEAEQGEAGIEMARQLHPQVVLCDLLMPRSNGFQVCRALRADPSLRGIRIIIATGRNFETDKRAALEAGADEYLPKPIAINQLMDVLGRLIKDGNGNGKDGFARPSGPAQFKFWGVRGSIPTPGPGTVKFGGNTSCIEVRVGGEIIILDAGTGLRPLGISLLNEFKEQPLNLTLLLTHTHWDHIQGLPFFPPIYRPQNRLRILGYEGARTSLHTVLSGQMESPYFPVTFGELPGNVEIEELRDMKFNVGNVRVEAFFANHPGICVGYRIFSEEGSLAFFPDNELHYPHRHSTGHADKPQSLDFARAEDTKMVEFLHGVDALIMDSQYDSHEYKDHVGWGHGCVDDVVELAMRAEAKKLFLFHHDPDHDDARVEAIIHSAKQIVARAKSPMQVDGAREREVVQLASLKRAK